MSTFTKKRIFADVRELQEEGSGEYWAEPLEDNIFEVRIDIEFFHEWHSLVTIDR